MYKERGTSRLRFWQSGLSIIELLVALALGALLTVGLVQIFTSNSQTFRVNEAEARSQETGRVVTDVVSRALRNAGYFGCFPVNDVTNNLDVTDEDYDASIHVFSVEGLSAEDAERPADAIAGTDFFRVSGLRTVGAVAADADVNSSSISVKDDGGLVAGNIVMINDCKNGDVFEISVVQDNGSDFTLVANNQDSQAGQPGNDFSLNAPAACTIAPCLGATYSKGVRVRRIFNESYYIGTGASGNPAFFLDAGAGAAAVEVADNVLGMQVRFGEGTVANGVQNWRDNAAAVGEWGNVIAVQISFLVRAGEGDVLAQAMSYCYPGWLDCSVAGNQTAAPDSRLYRVYTLTTSIRNRI